MLLFFDCVVIKDVHFLKPPVFCITMQDNKTVECGLIPHAYVRQVLKDTIPLDLGENELQSLCLYYEHPYILHFFRYRDFLQDAQFGIVKACPALTTSYVVTKYIHISIISLFNSQK